MSSVHSNAEFIGCVRRCALCALAHLPFGGGGRNASAWSSAKNWLYLRWIWYLTKDDCAADHRSRGGRGGKENFVGECVALI